MKWFLGLCLIPLVCVGEIQVAFLELRTPQGKVVYLEDGFPYAHVAITEGEGWWHAYPRRLVESVSYESLEKIGRVGKIFEISGKFSPKKIDRYKGRLYDTQFDWSDDSLYCSELVAKLLSIHPGPMHFDPRLWPPVFQKLEGKPGISPRGIFEVLQKVSRETP